MGSHDLIVERSGPAATLIINRPEQRNAITYEMWGRLPALLADLDTDPAVRVVLIRGAGERAFSAGADIKDFEETRSTPAKARAYRGSVEAACASLGALGKPTVAVIQGYCIGGGCELALFADIRVGDETAMLGVPAAKRGLAVSHPLLSRLEHLAGVAIASYLLLTARLIDARDAQRSGLLNAVVPTADLDAYIKGLVTDIAEGSPVSHRLHKAVLADLVTYGAVDRVPEDRRALPETSEASEDFREGVRAFMERRKPRFSGR